MASQSVSPTRGRGLKLTERYHSVVLNFRRLFLFLHFAKGVREEDF